MVWASGPLDASGTSISKVVYTIGELSREYSVTLRALRFYENKGLISPQRDGLNRLYSDKDRNRLALILKGKRLSFTLGEIRQMIAAEEERGRQNRPDAEPREVPGADRTASAPERRDRRRACRASPHLRHTDGRRHGRTADRLIPSYPASARRARGWPEIKTAHQGAPFCVLRCFSARPFDLAWGFHLHSLDNLRPVSGFAHSLGLFPTFGFKIRLAASFPYGPDPLPALGSEPLPRAPLAPAQRLTVHTSACSSRLGRPFYEVLALRLRKLDVGGWGNQGEARDRVGSLQRDRSGGRPRVGLWPPRPSAATSSPSAISPRNSASPRARCASTRRRACSIPSATASSAATPAATAPALSYVLAGKCVGFSLEEVREMLDLYDLDDGHVTQLKVALSKFHERIARLERQKTDIDRVVAELTRASDAMKAKLAVLGHDLD